jgi:hypothetical protein
MCEETWDALRTGPEPPPRRTVSVRDATYFVCAKSISTRGPRSVWS